MTDFLLELRSEEIPARMQDGARANLARLFAAELAKAGLAAPDTVTYATPRRLVLIARGLPDATQPVREETKGPRASAPPQALEGFLRKTGLARDGLVERDGVLFAVVEKPGRATRDVLAEAIPAIVRAFPWPKSMRWGAASASTESARWVRPLHGIVALFGDEIVPCAAAGVEAGATTLGHRFHHPGPITLGGAHDYVEKLRACHVIVDQDERAAIIRTRAAELAAGAELALVEDEGLVAENAGLTEWPVPLLGRFDAAFLDVPPEVVQLTARVNQKYFVCTGADGTLAPAFICTANIEAADGGAKIVEGNRKVLAARLADARFFYETDLRTPLDEQAKKLEKIVFHEKLGTVADKAERVAKLARWLVEEGIVTENSSPERGGGSPAKPMVEGLGARHGSAEPAPPPSLRDGPSPRSGEELASLAHRAALLAKADLVTGMVGEFPELQGVMGGYYAKAQGEPREVREAIRDHYKPVGQGDEVPTAPVTVAVSLADKLDTLVGFFAIDETPTGSKDPFALRRAMLGTLSILESNAIRLSLKKLFRFSNRNISQALVKNLLHSWSSSPGDLEQQFFEAIDAGEPFERRDDMTYFSSYHGTDYVGHVAALIDLMIERVEGVRIESSGLDSFAADRLKVQQREAGVRHDLIDAVFALGGEDDLVRLLARVGALQSFVGTDDGANLLAGYKRAANILKKEGYSPSPRLRGEGAERSEGGRGAVETPGTAPLPSAALPRGSLPLPAIGERENPLSYTPEKAETALVAALDAAEPAAAAAVEAEDFAAAMTALASLRAPIDAFFETVTVNDADPAKRAARLALLARVRDAVHRVADFSKIEG